MPDRDRENLESGYTTGACATITTKAGLMHLLNSETPETVSIGLPAGERAEQSVRRLSNSRNSATFATEKDAGDDPDVTDGAIITTTVSLNGGKDIEFRGGAGVGTVTRPGLPVEKGEPAINPVPRQMMKQVTQEFRQQYGLTGGLTLTVNVRNGRELAERTLNPRLGIEDGLSILGTTGIVEPYSHASYIASIEQGIDVAVENGLNRIVLSTGGRTEKNAQARTDLPEYGYVQFAGYLRETLIYLSKHDFGSVQFYFMPGKFSKFAQGNLSLHSSDSSVNFEQLQRTIRELGGDPSPVESLNSVNQIFSKLSESLRRDVVDEWISRIPAILENEFGEIPWEELSITVLNLDGEELGRRCFRP
ncbi:MAG: cobalt-precorrin-5B (C(1))-methyltransferase [bacterium]